MKLASLLLLLTVSGLFAQTALTPLPSDGFVPLEQIVSDFSAQPDAALKKYNGQLLLVYGRVGQVAKADDMEGNPLAVYLQLPNQTTPDVKGIFTLADIPNFGQNAEVQVAEDGSQATIFHRGADQNINQQEPFVAVGQNIGMRGSFDNFIAGDVVLKDCKKVTKERLAETLAKHGISN